MAPVDTLPVVTLRDALREAVRLDPLWVQSAGLVDNAEWARKADSKRCGQYLDLAFREANAWLRKYPKRWKALHVKDQLKGTPGNPNGKTDVEWNVVVGTGNQDMPAVMQAARKIGIKYYFIEDESSRSVEQVPVSIKYLTPLIKK